METDFVEAKDIVVGDDGYFDFHHGMALCHVHEVRDYGEVIGLTFVDGSSQMISSTDLVEVLMPRPFAGGILVSA